MFNLSKFSQVPELPITPTVIDATQDVTESVEDKTKNDFDTSDIVDRGDNEDRTGLLNQEQNIVLWQQLQQMLDADPKYADIKDTLLNHPEIMRLSRNLSTNNIQDIQRALEEADLQGSASMLPGSSQSKIDLNSIRSYVDKLDSVIRQQSINRSIATQNPNAAIPSVAFNLSRHKMAQMSLQAPEMDASSQQMEMTTEMGKFPVKNVGDFIDQFLPALLSWKGNKGSGDKISNSAVTEIQGAVGQGFEQEANSALTQIQQLDPVIDRNKAEEILIHIYQNWLTPLAKGGDNMQEQTQNPLQDQSLQEPVMATVKDSTIHLSSQVLNNQTGFIKTAADQFGQQYLLYGPTEKRICPKLRGKGVSDVVSEYTCRHHCLDGIVIDDNKTICGEALWRANVMDKFSTDYVDEDGESKGGYLNKRFEINRNVPEENKMRLKPGETRKPRPASWGSLEARMQDMRNKEGEKRDYRPDTNVGKPFNWTKDIDQNNVQVAQSERDSREEEKGHELVQYTDKNNQENKPKKQAFNLNKFKTAQAIVTSARPPGNLSIDELPPQKNQEPDFNSLMTWLGNASTSEHLQQLRSVVEPRYLSLTQLSLFNEEFKKVEQLINSSSADQLNKQTKLRDESQPRKPVRPWQSGPTDISNDSLRAHQTSAVKIAQLDDFGDLEDGWGETDDAWGESEDVPYGEPDSYVDENENNAHPPQPGDVYFKSYKGPFFEVEGGMIAKDVGGLRNFVARSGNFSPDIWQLDDYGNPQIMSWDEVFAQLEEPKHMAVAPVSGNGMAGYASSKGFNLNKYNSEKHSLEKKK